MKSDVLKQKFDVISQGINGSKNLKTSDLYQKPMQEILDFCLNITCERHVKFLNF